MAAGVLLALSGCSDPAPAGTVPTSTPTKASSPPAPSPSATSPEQQVEAAVRTYYAELTKAAQTNDTTRLKQLMDESCPCYGAVRAIDSDATKGRSTPKARWTVVSVNVHDLAGATAAAEVSFDVNAYNLVDKDGTVISRVAARRDRVDLSFGKRQDAWILANVFNLGGR
jgi:hypothetical protein